MNVNKIDVYGNTALHIAVMLGHRDCINLLLSYGADAVLKNREGWSALGESISYGSYSLTLTLYERLRNQLLRPEKVSEFARLLSAIPDCQLDFDWEIVSWVPFVSDMLPSDTCRVRKVGGCLRLDTSLLEFTSVNHGRGDLSIVFNPRNQPAMVILDHQKKNYRSVGGKTANLEHDVNILRNSELIHTQLVADKLLYSQNGFRGIRWNRHRHASTVGKYSVRNYTVSNIIFRVVRRREHLNEGNSRRKTEMAPRMRRFSPASFSQPSLSRSNSLCPPPGHRRILGPGEFNPSPLSWEVYKSGVLESSQTYLARRPDIRRTEKRIKLSVSMTDEIPLCVTHLLDMIRIVSPLNKFRNLHQALARSLPAGFPVRLEMPLAPTVMGRVVFTDVTMLRRKPTYTLHWDERGSSLNISKCEDSMDDIFRIPTDYQWVGEYKLTNPQKSQSKR
ncbi:unnamed protein product [Calicophoron daubneyi]|uniref:Ankyrin repeat domain-containing protein n=1 Tax=Calicophoron daubneyi TaxID=300641 RepID=A0AAV2T845_CALDB